ncbi:hypothetical protein [Undibacterium flavidum]|uniref:Uncharacterized protein n=1 Tax=Undibacterium flavidum TaxID=2762297 RepID=A0ABR6YDJ7_9BURK|nr:hypothetical protein [Undibacterium flavidum]MBC3874608.1 hypothetical protein [Undibacterium flavidum]
MSDLKMRAKVQAVIIVSVFSLSAMESNAYQRLTSDQIKDNQLEFIRQTKSLLSECGNAYQNYLATERLSDLALEAKQSANDAKARLSNKSPETAQKAPTTPFHLECINRNKPKILDKSKVFISSFKANEMKMNPKSLIAQWMTALDSIDKQVAQGERAKFETIANNIIIELQ